MDSKEYNIAVNAHSGNLYRYLLKLLRQEDDASDLVQDAYLKLWIHKKDIEVDKAKSWLFTTARNAMLNQLKKDKRTESMEKKKFVEPYVSGDRYDLKEVIDKGLEQLPEIQKSIILLRDLEGYNYKEIGEILNLNEAQVKVYLFRGRQKLKETLKGISSYHESN